jgi:hypothetical protein
MDWSDIDFCRSAYDRIAIVIDKSQRSCGESRTETETSYMSVKDAIAMRDKLDSIITSIQKDTSVRFFLEEGSPCSEVTVTASEAAKIYKDLKDKLTKLGIDV